MNVNGGGDGARAGGVKATGVEVNEGAKYGNGDGSRNGAGIGTGTGVETRGRSQNRSGDGSGDGSGEGGGRVTKRRKPHKNCRHDQALFFRTRHHLGKQGVVLVGTQQLRLQSLVPVHAHRTEGVARPERQELLNGFGSRIGVWGGNRNGNGVGGGYEMEREREQERGWRRTRERKMGAAMGAGTGRERGRGWSVLGEHKMGAGLETRAIEELGMGTRMGAETRIGSRGGGERRRSARNHTRLVD